ncbi:MAG: GFA family protein [Rhodospirillales bacterium]|nr:GFA family protein [Rhodospirillales bacterium]
MLHGGCLCGAIRYTTDGVPYHESICHCSICRRASGAPFVAWFSVPRQSLSLVSGAPGWFRSSPAAERGFCARCGTALFFRSSAHPDEIDITTASLDDPALVPPRDEIYTETRIAWLATLPRLPSFAAAREQAAPPRPPTPA